MLNVMQAVVRTTQPPHLQRLAVIVVMGVNARSLAANLAGLGNEPAGLARASGVEGSSAPFRAPSRPRPP